MVVGFFHAFIKVNVFALLMKDRQKMCGNNVYVANKL